jgi:outer membrane protein OmpA-like peptidoglycan-associated protein
MNRSMSNRNNFSIFRLALLVFAGLIAVSLPGLIRAQNNAFRIGVLPFADNTGSGGGDVAGSVSRAVQAEIVHSTQLQGRVLKLDEGLDPNNLDSDKAIAMGRAQNVDVVIIGTVLEANSDQSTASTRGPSIGGFSLGGNKQTIKATVTLQADLFSTSTGQKIDSIRQTGTASQTKIGADADTSLGNLNTGGANFDNSAIGKAFHSAVADLVKKINSEQAQMTRYTGSGAAAVSAAAPASAPANAAAPVAAVPAVAAQAAGAGAAGGSQPDFKTVKIDFVPGERTVLYDDFSDMQQDEPPPHWRLRDGKVDLRIAGNVRELYAADSVNLFSPNFVLPANFTFELEWTGGGETTWHFMDKGDQEVLSLVVRGEEDGMTASAHADATCDGCGDLGMGQIQTDTNQPVEFGLWAQQGRVRLYLNGQRLIDVNQVNLPAITHLNASIAGYRPNGIRKVRLAESAPDASAILASTGKYVTHGINFDTDSDRLKADSAPVIKQIADALAKNPALKLEIDGYTDSVGDAAHNVDLSNRRAQAVQTVLVGQFGVTAARLSSKGMGQANPISSNDTPIGRAANRRVEFVKQ